MITSLSKNVYIDKLDDIVNKYNNTYHSTTKVEPVDVKSNTYIDSKKEINDKNAKSKIGDIVTIPKYKNIFTKNYIADWSEEVFVHIRGHILLIIKMEKKLLERFTKTNCKK